MKASRYIVLLYATMVLVPFLLFITMLATAFADSALVRLLEALIAVGLFVYGIMGIVELFAYKSAPEKNLQVVSGNEVVSIQIPKQKNERRIRMQVKRFDKDNKEFREVSYVVNANRFTTVLDGLISIKSEQDSSLSVRYSCRMGICGSCGIVVNGKPSLACETCLFDSVKDEKVEVEPMQAHPLLKDLVTDFDDFFEKHMQVQPSLYRKDSKEQTRAASLYKQTNKELEKYLPFSYCIMCGLCMDACPVVNSNKEFVGPQALSQAYRYYKDSRDQMGEKRLNIIDKLDSVWGCEFAGACSEVCPKGVDPATAIQALKFDIFKDYLAKE